MNRRWTFVAQSAAPGLAVRRLAVRRLAVRRLAVRRLAVRRLAVLALAALAPLGGCADAPARPPPPPDPDGGPILRAPPTGGHRDGGSDASAADGSLDADGGPAAGCVVVGDGPSEPNRVDVVLDGAAVSFPVAAAFALWDASACDRPTLVLGLSEMSCVPGVGQQLLFLLARDEIGTSVVPGDNLLEAAPFDDSLSVRYLKPAGLATTQVWGSCSGASGSITFARLGTRPGDAVRGTFTMTLTDCASPPVQPMATVSGAFDLTVPNTFESVCP